MAEPGDPHSEDDHAHDALIGFTSPASLAGVARPRPPVEPEPEPEPEPKADADVESDPSVAAHEADEDLFKDDDHHIPSPTPPESESEPESVEPVAEKAASPADDDLGPLVEGPLNAVAAARLLESKPETAAQATRDPLGLPSWARETFRSSNAPAKTFGRADKTAPPEGAMGLYTVYALILFAVPTFGVSALVALYMMWTRSRPEQPLALSHFIFQQRTLWAAAIGAALGVALIAVNLGVFVLVAAALWVIVRGTYGVLRLASGRPIERPRYWWI